MQIAKNVKQWNRTLWGQQKNPEKQFSFGDYVLWFSKGNKSHLKKFTRKWFGPDIVQYVLPNNIVLLVTIKKLETNPMLPNVNKLKPHKQMEFEVHKKEQQMPIYWERNESGVQEVNSKHKGDDEGCQIHKPQMMNDEDKEQITNLMMNIVFIFNM